MCLFMTRKTNDYEKELREQFDDWEAVRGYTYTANPITNRAVKEILSKPKIKIAKDESSEESESS